MYVDRNEIMGKYYNREREKRERDIIKKKKNEGKITFASYLHLHHAQHQDRPC